MAITKQKRLRYFNVDGVNKTVSIGIETYFYDDVTGEDSSKIKTGAFSSGQIEDVKAWAGVGNNNPYIVLLNSIWA